MRNSLSPVLLALALVAGCEPASKVSVDASISVADPGDETLAYGAEPEVVGVENDKGDGPSTTIEHPTPAGPNELLAVVQVVKDGRPVCTGNVVAPNRVLTAAHCFCQENDIGHNDCLTEGAVDVRPDPRTGGVPPRIHGTVIVHPGYDPSWIDRAIHNDLAIIQLERDVPSYVVPFTVSRTTRGSGARVVVAGFGRTGGGCDIASSNTLNWANATINSSGQGPKIFQFNDRVGCRGDSGGPITDTNSRTVLFGVLSSMVWTISHGDINKATDVAPFYDWIKSHTCSSDLETACDRRAPICRCAAGRGDCDVNTDCETGLVCTQDVGSLFGYPPATDVCTLFNQPIGTCSCRNSGAANICIATNRCAAHYMPSCDPDLGSPGEPCGGCTCVRRP